MGRPFSKFRPRLYLFITAIICQLLAPLIPAFDTSHLVPPNRISDFLDSEALPLNFSHDSPVDGDMASSSSYLPDLVPPPGLRWDALHYLDVASYGAYSFEHQYAFSPGVPIVLRVVNSGKELLLAFVSYCSPSGSLNTQLRAWLGDVMNAFLVAMLAAQPCLVLYRLTEKVTHSKQFSYLTLAVHVLMGAPPVMLRSAYAEPFFAWFTFEGLCAYHDQSYSLASLYFALATAFRTNGIILPCFILYSLLVHPILLELISTISNTSGFRIANTPKHLYLASRKLRFSNIIYGALLTIVSLSPFIAQQYAAYLAFCQTPSPRPWCDSKIPLIYSFVQSHYWDVGLWRYWTIAQIPNFLLALPMLALTVSSIVWFAIASSRSTRFTPERADSPPSDLALSPVKALTLLPYALHALVLSLILFTAAHVQIALRVLPAATPWASWAGAALIIQGARHRRDTETNTPSRKDSVDRSWWPLLSNLWIGWSVTWLFVSSILWLAFLPPA